MLITAVFLQAASPMRVLERGTQSFIDVRKEVVARSQAELDAVWKLHSPARTAPPVDFGSEMVVGIFAGSRNTAGYSLEIVSVQEEPTPSRALVVRYREKQPPPAAVVAQVLTSPYVLLAVPRYAGDVRFEKIQPF
jgi:hypothetical protein